MAVERDEYKGRRIEVRSRGGALRAETADLELLIDDEPVEYGELPDGSYFLHDYAYDWQDNLMDLARRFIDYERAADEVRPERFRDE